jgi:hypothetical protein
VAYNKKLEKKMIGWKIEYNGTVCEVVGMPMCASSENSLTIIIPVYYNKVIKMVWFGNSDEIKVIERK